MSWPAASGNADRWRRCPTNTRVDSIGRVALNLGESQDSIYDSERIGRKKLASTFDLSMIILLSLFVDSADNLLNCGSLVTNSPQRIYFCMLCKVPQDGAKGMTNGEKRNWWRSYAQVTISMHLKSTVNLLQVVSARYKVFLAHIEIQSTVWNKNKPFVSYIFKTKRLQWTDNRTINLDGTESTSQRECADDERSTTCSSGEKGWRYLSDASDHCGRNSRTFVWTNNGA